MQRKLAAIFATDVVGYSRLMEADEAGTLARLKSTRENLIDPKIAAHNGRTVKLMGDGALVEFPSVVDAVACAVEIQQTMAECNEELPVDRRLELRIGVNLGDVIVEGQDIYGDGVNVAARLEGLAEPGGVVISGTAFDHVERKLSYAFEYGGEQKVKNIEKPVRLYRIRVDARAPIKAAPARAKHSRLYLLPAIIGVLLALSAGGLFWMFREYSAPPIEPASKARMEHPLPDKPSIAVLPFANMSSEAGQQHFADGLTDSLITDLSKISRLFVIARNSTFVYQGKPVKVSQVAEDLGVRYVLEGSVQRAGDQLRVNAQLIDALNGGHIWADRFDGNVTNIFAAQDAFVKKIVEALQITLTAGERQEIASGKTNNILAKEAFDEGWSLYLNYSPKDIAAAITALNKATELDPSYGRAYAALALVYFRIIDSYWFEEFGMPVQQVFAKAVEYVKLANKHPTSLSYIVAAYGDAFQGREEDALRNAQRAIALDPNDPEAHIGMAWVLICLGEPTEALNFVATAMRLDPNNQMHYAFTRGFAFYVMGDLKQAAQVLEEGVKQNPNAAELFIPFTSILAQLGRREEARQMLQRFLPGLDQKGLENFPDTYVFAQWDKLPRMRERLYDGLRVAALPLDITVGVMTIDPRLVVSNTKAEAYQVLPLQAGMLQLLKDGALASKERGSFDIVKKMRYPAELTGLNNMRFVLKKGVPIPDGDSGDSCVYSEDMNQFIAKGIGCRFSE